MIYAYYTFYLGVAVMKKCPQEKAVPYTIVVVICGFLLGAVLGGVLMSVVIGGSVMGMMGGLS
jgi:membrane associated rhomboid family serine protease